MHYMIVATVEQLKSFTPGTAPRPSPEIESNFYAHVGVVISAWQFVEEMIWHIYERTIGLSSSRPLAASFYSAHGFRARLEMVNSAILQSTDIAEQRVVEWQSIYKHAVAKSKRRNALAHSIVVFHLDSSGKTGELYMRPSTSNANRSALRAFPTPQEDRIGIDHLDQMYQSFERLRVELFEYLMQLPVPAAHDVPRGS